jgi:hypothetical protein
MEGAVRVGELENRDIQGLTPPLLFERQEEPVPLLLSGFGRQVLTTCLGSVLGHTMSKLTSAPRRGGWT